MRNGKSLMTAAALLAVSLFGRGAAALDLNAFPVLAYQPETSTIFGAAAMATFRDTTGAEGGRPDNAGVFLMYSAKNQLLTAIEPDLYFGEDDRWQLKVALLYRNFPDSWYGLGGDTSEDDEEVFTTDDFEVFPRLLMRVYRGFGVGLNFRYRRSSMIEAEPGGVLTLGIPGVEGYATSGSRPGAGDGLLPGSRGSEIAGLGAVLDWDTRDNIFAPERGSWLSFTATAYDGAVGSGFDFRSYLLDLRKYIPLGAGHVLALQAVGRTKEGEVPLTELADLGKVRGILQSRYRGLHMMMAQAEYRFPLPAGVPFSRRLRGSLFGAAGSLACRKEDLRLADAKATFGFGLRFVFDRDEKIALRFDMGIGEDGAYPYFQMNEAF